MRQSVETELRSIKRRIRRARELGLSDLIALIVNEVGFHTKMKFSYPESQHFHNVMFNPIWHDIEKARWEYFVLKFIFARVKEGDIVLDVGSWIGPYTLAFSDKVGNSGRVIAFEPDPIARNMLIKNIAMNNITNVLLEELGVSDSKTTARLISPRFGSSLSSIVSQNLDSRKGIEILTVTLDDYCTRENYFPKWIKIDVEGAENRVLDGMQEIIQKVHPNVILEVHGQLLGKDEMSALWAKITRFSKEIFYIDGQCDAYDYLEKLSADKIPVCDYFIIYVKY